MTRNGLKINLVIALIWTNFNAYAAQNLTVESQNEGIVGQEAVCKLVEGPLNTMFGNEQYNLIFHVLSKSITLNGSAPYILFELGPDGKPSKHWKICINIERVKNTPSPTPDFPYLETKIESMQEIAAICEKEPPVPAMCYELLASNLENRSFFIIGQSKASEAHQSVVASKTIPAKSLILKADVTPLNLKHAEPTTKQEPPPAVSATPVMHPAVLPNSKTHQTQSETPAGDEDNRDWIMAQPSENYTLQVMVLSSKASVQRFLKKYAEYSDNLKYFGVGINDQQKYVLIYGSFPSRAEAKKNKANLPAEFNKSLERSFKLVQNEMPLKTAAKTNDASPNAKEP